MTVILLGELADQLPNALVCELASVRSPEEVALSFRLTQPADLTGRPSRALLTWWRAWPVCRGCAR